jgi:hypothetical protein
MVIELLLKGFRVYSIDKSGYYEMSKNNLLYTDLKTNQTGLVINIDLFEITRKGEVYEK